MPWRNSDRDEVAILDRKYHSDDLNKHDEVWNGVDVVMPLPNDEHQGFLHALSIILGMIYGLKTPPYIRPGVNVSDRVENWVENYRCPDFVVFLEGNPAINYGTHWCGGPDFLTEIASTDDRCWDKLPFYASLKTHEALIINRDPWELELYQLQEDDLVLVGKSSLAQPNLLTSSVLPLTFRLVPAADRPQIEVVHPASSQSWRI